jgi:6-pyruvoyltetrahydropterin/6-carboxytetrahydropterin synthase
LRSPSPHVGLGKKSFDAGAIAASNLVGGPVGSARRLRRRHSPTIPKSMKITQAFRFEAAHYLPNVPEAHRCHRMHGHSYRVELELSGPIDPVTGFVLDFFEIEGAFGPLLARLDHYCLNEVEGLENPTAETIAIWIWRNTKPALPLLSRVRIYETSDCWADYAGEDD